MHACCCPHGHACSHSSTTCHLHCKERRHALLGQLMATGHILAQTCKLRSSGRCCAATAASQHAFHYATVGRMATCSIYRTLGFGGRLCVRTSVSTLGSYVVPCVDNAEMHGCSTWPCATTCMLQRAGKVEAGSLASGGPVLAACVALAPPPGMCMHTARSISVGTNRCGWGSGGAAAEQPAPTSHTRMLMASWRGQLMVNWRTVQP